jgi:hypothetical protein
MAMAGSDRSGSELDAARPDDVAYDRRALDDAERKMHVSRGEGDHDEDPEGGHDPAALKDAARRMGAED